MADYYSILKKTIASLPESNGAARRSVYSRARNAIVNQLKAYEPPLSPSEITAEQLRLEEAIRKVEAEAARESLGLAPSVSKPQSAARQPEAPAEPAEKPAPAQDKPEPVAEPAQSAESPAPAAADPVPSPLKETLSEAQSLGTAANQAVQNAKDAVEPSGEPAAAEPATGRREPAFSTPAPVVDSLSEVTEAASLSDQDLYADAVETGPEVHAGKRGRTERNRPSAADALKSGSASGRLVPLVAGGLVLLLLLAAAAFFFMTSDEQTAGNGQSEPQTATAVQPVTDPEAAETGTASDIESSKNADRLLSEEDAASGAEVIAPDARTVTTTTITPQSSDTGSSPSQPAIVNSGSDERVPQVSESIVDAPRPAAGADSPLAVPQNNLAAIAPDERTTTPAPAANSGGAQRSILYEEGEESGGAGTAAQGAATWTIVEETNLDGKQQSVLNASVEIPERDIKVDVRIKPNDDTSLPASHLVEIKYEFPEGFAAGDVVNVPGLVMKPTEEARGDALIGASVKVSPGFFWIALSSLPNERERNLALLRERGWIDIPMLYENGKRGILTIEKGAPGAEVVEQAVTAWEAG